MRKEQGFTLLELMMVLTVLGVITAMAVPAVSTYIEKKKVIAAAEAVYGQLQYARSEAISRSTDVFVNFSANGSTTWKMATSASSGCDIGQSDGSTVNDCILVVDDGDGILHGSDSDGDGTPDVVDAGDTLIYPGLSSAAHEGITLGGATAGSNVSFFGTGAQVRFDSVRGTASNGTVYLKLGSKYEMRVLVSPVGRIKVCSPTGSTNVPEYSVCP